MEDNKIVVKINNSNIELSANSPNIKSLVELILQQDAGYDFNEIEIECNDERFDKEGFKSILIKSINDYKDKLIIEENKNNKRIESLEKEKQKIESDN